MKVKILKMLEEGKSDLEIAKSVLESEESKGLEADEVAELIVLAKKEQAVLESLKATERESEAKKQVEASEKKFDEKVKSAVDEKLKSLNIDPKGSLRPAKIEKRFDTVSGKMIDVDSAQFSEGYKACNELIRAMANKDPLRVKAISDEIEEDNARYGVKATQRSDSDSVGGYSIPTEVESTIAQLTYAQSVMLPKVNKNVITYEDKIFPTIGDITMSYIANQDTAVTESSATFSNPTINMERIGAFTRVSNTLLRQKDVDLTNALTIGYASAWARFIDTQLIIGNITGNSDLLDGLVWLGTQETTPVALASLSESTLLDMTENIDNESDQGSIAWIGNRKIKNAIGVLETTGGQRLFPNYTANGEIAPAGYPFIMNDKITNVLDVGGDDSTGGTDTALILSDLSKFVVGINGGLRIDTSTDESFTKDLTTFRGLQTVGWGVLFAGTTRVQEITGAS